VSSPASAAADGSQAVLDGTVERLASTEEADQRVLRFLLHTDSGFVPVEMRGDELRGVVSDGDHVQFAGSRASDGTAHPRTLTNLTTGAQVELWTAPRGLRVARFVGTSAVTAGLGAVVSGLIGVAIGAVFSSRSSGSQSPPPGPPPSDGSSGWSGTSIGLLCFLIGLLLIVAYLIRARRRRRTIRVAVVVGLAIGAIVSGVTVALVL
jgi:hypothetical protein